MISCSGKVVVNVLRNGVSHTEITINNQLLSTFTDWVTGRTMPNFHQAKAVVGTGSTPNTNNTVSLERPLANVTWQKGSCQATSITRSTDGNTYEGNITTKVIYPIGAIVGLITEYGFSYDNSSDDSVMSRALVTDNSGNVTGIQITKEDQLILTHVITITVPATTTATFDLIDGNNVAQYNFTHKVVRSDMSADNLLTIAHPNYGQCKCYSGKVGAKEQYINYTTVSHAVENGVKVLTLNIPAGRLNAEMVEYGLAKIILSSGQTCYGYEFSPPVTIQANDGLTLKFAHQVVSGDAV